MSGAWSLLALGAWFSCAQTTDVPRAAAPVAAEGNGLTSAQPRRLADCGLAGLGEVVNLKSFDAWDVVQLIDFLAHRGGLNNIVVSKGVSGLTTKLKFDNVTVGDALEVVLSVNNLAYEVKGGIITIMTDAEYSALHGVSFYDQKHVGVLELKYADAGRVASMLQPVKSTIGTLVSDPVTGTLILIDTPPKIEEMRRIVAKTDLPTIARVVPTETKTFVLQYADPADVQKQVTGMLTEQVGRLRADARTKTLMVTDLPHRLREIEEMIALFDRRQRQVFIEAKIVEVTLSDAFNMGINWQHMFEAINPRASIRAISKPLLTTVPASLSQEASKEVVSGGTLTYNTIVQGGDLQVLLQALQQIGDTKILQNPHIAVMDGQEATIEVIEDQPYKEVTLESGTTNVTGVTYLFKKVGVQLDVTPRINDEEMISVAIKPEISSIAEWYDGGPQQGTPVVKRSYAETTVMVKNGVTIIIGGMIRNERSTGTSRVPILGGIPLVGRLFRHDSSTTVNKETVVFLTPRIISGEESFLRMQDMKKPPKPLRPVGRSSGKPFKPVR